jgi:hypothetical protein
MPDRTAWLGEVRAWVVETTGPDVELEIVRERAWGVIVRVTTTDGVLFFKEPGPNGRHESVVVDDIASGWPGLVPDVLAADLERSWLLMEDHGSPMWDSLSPGEQIALLEPLLLRYGAMQRGSRELLDRWMAAGVPDRRVERLPALVDELLAGSAWIGELPLTAEQRSAVEGTRRDLAGVCGELAATTFATAIDHSDMHGGNVLIGRGTPRIIDWGDACVSHPFASLFVPFQHAVARSPQDARRRAALRLRDAYLEAWRDDAPVADLRAAFAHATWLGYPIRALNFVHQMGEADAEQCRKDVAQFLVRMSEKGALLGDPDELVAAIADQTEY